VAYGGRTQKSIYGRLPSGLRNLAATWYSIRTYPTRHGRYFHESLARLKKNEWLSDDELEKIQIERLRVLLEHAGRSVPYYRTLFDELGLAPKDIATIGDLSKVPLLNKERVRKDGVGLLADGIKKSDLLCVHTSGTTGTPLDIYQTRELFQKEYAFWWFHRSWAGVALGDRTATLAGHPVTPAEQTRPPFWVRNYRENQLIFSSYHMSHENMRYYCDALGSFRPELIHGYPSSVYLVALHLNDNGITTVRPKAVFTSSETILDHQRTEIERAFSCKVFPYYGNVERAGYIGECEEGNLHCLAEHSIVEVLGDDDRPARPGEPGVLVCTNIDNMAMPMIRYVTNDVAIPLPPEQKCPCGRGGRLLKSVLGRVEDYVVTPDGRYVGRMDHILKGVENVKEAQIYQPSTTRIVVRVVRDASFRPEDEQALLDNTRERLGADIEVTFDYVARIERTGTGKFRFIVSDIPIEERLRVPE